MCRSYSQPRLSESKLCCKCSVDTVGPWHSYFFFFLVFVFLYNTASGIEGNYHTIYHRTYNVSDL